MDMLWNGWGDPAKAAPLPETVTALLRDLLGVQPRSTPALRLDDVRPPAPTTAPAALRALADAVGEEHVRTDAEIRVRHTRGKSTPDLLRLRAGDVTDVPQAVVLPAGHDEVLAVLRACAAHGLAVVPFGGGTSVVGGLAPQRSAFVALDLRRMNALLDLDPLSRTAVLQPGLRAPEAEALLAARGFTLGHFPQSFEWATIGGFAAARSSGQASAGYGRFDEMVLALTLATPEGTIDTGRAPRSAAGPDLRQLILGSEGAFGVITSVTVRIRPLPEVRTYEGWRFASFEEGAAALRRLAQDGPRPTVLRLSDETETFVGLAQPDAIGAGPAAPIRPAAARAAWRSPGTRGPPRTPPTAASGRPPSWRTAAAPRPAPHRANAGRTAATPRRTCATRCSTPAPSPRRWRPRPSGPASPSCTAPCAPP